MGIGIGLGVGIRSGGPVAPDGAMQWDDGSYMLWDDGTFMVWS
jgi:hypothetical protein